MSVRDVLRRRLDADERYGLRLTLALLAAGLAIVPGGLLALLVRSRWSPLRGLDQAVDNSLHGYAVAHPGLVRFLDAVSTFGAPNVWRALVVLGALLLIRRAPRLAIWMAVTLVGEALLDVGIKTAVDRLRPSFPDPVAVAPGKSFPSGHAMGSFVLVGVLVLVVLPLLPRRARWPVVALGVAVVVLIGFSRLGLGVHYPSDVVGGWVIGAAWLAGTVAAFQTWRREAGRRGTAPGVDPELPAELNRRP